MSPFRHSSRYALQPPYTSDPMLLILPLLSTTIASNVCVVSSGRIFVAIGGSIALSVGAFACSADADLRRRVSGFSTIGCNFYKEGFQRCKNFHLRSDHD
eukprot:m.37911 g.37911  ORF g.37911 m.37911 type:complete len:100 (+) comp14601_c0_seq5:2903-3202(+)